LVVRNLLENALNATAAAGGGTIQIQAEATERSVIMVMSDNGIGFPPAARTKIFDSFFRVGSEINRRTPGSGLGLAIARRYLELDGGRIHASSEGSGTGATLTVHWRRVPGTEGGQAV
jgi:signal transduction histidine kinase